MNINNNTTDAGEVELLLSDATAVEGKVIMVLMRLFGRRNASGGCSWLMTRLLENSNACSALDAHVRRLVDIELNKRKDEYK